MTSSGYLVSVFSSRCDSKHILWPLLVCEFFTSRRAVVFIFYDLCEVHLWPILFGSVFGILFFGIPNLLYTIKQKLKGRGIFSQFYCKISKYPTRTTSRVFLCSRSLGTYFLCFMKKISPGKSLHAAYTYLHNFITFIL